MSNNFKVLVIAHDFAGFKNGDVYVCRDNEYYTSNDIYNKQFHKDLLSKENPNLDFGIFSKAEKMKELVWIKRIPEIWEKLKQTEQ